MLSLWLLHLQSRVMRLLQSPSVLKSSSHFSSTFSRHSLRTSSFVSGSPNLAALLQGRSSHSRLLQIHARVYRVNAHQDDLISTRLIGHYRSSLALPVFRQLRNPNIFPFNAIIRVLSEDGLFAHSFIVFKSLKEKSLSPNDLTFSFLFKACLRSDNEIYVKQVHSQILKTGHVCDSSVCIGLLGVYAKGFKDLYSACKLFDEMPSKSGVSCWTSFIAGCAQSGRPEEVMRLFVRMISQNLKPEVDTMVSVLSACSNLGNSSTLEWVDILEDLININSVDYKRPACDMVNTALVYLYGKLGQVGSSREKFDKIDYSGKRSVLPWNAMLGAYIQNNLPLEALNLFKSMVDDPSRTPNHVTMVNVLSACAQVGELEIGRRIHQYMRSEGRKGVLENNTFLATALIDMYCKCGSLDEARDVFSRLVVRDGVAFNAMIMGLAWNGEAEEAISLFPKMLRLGLYPNSGTFLALLCACSHSGLAEKGREIFRDMTLRFSLVPNLEHYSCYIDLLARAGFIEEALEVTASMPCKPNNFVWGALLGGCVIHLRPDLAQHVHNKLVELDPESSGSYTMLANLFAADRRWDEVSVLRWFMREKGVKKQPGRSWVTVNGEAHEFLANSPSHPKMEQILCTLTGLINAMKVSF